LESFIESRMNVRMGVAIQRMTPYYYFFKSFMHIYIIF